MKNQMSVPCCSAGRWKKLRGDADRAGFKGFRAKQLFQWLYRQKVRSLDETSNLPADYAKWVGEHYDWGGVELADERRSTDGSRKFAFRLHDGIQSTLHCQRWAQKERLAELGIRIVRSTRGPNQLALTAEHITSGEHVVRSAAVQTAATRCRINHDPLHATCLLTKLLEDVQPLSIAAHRAKRLVDPRTADDAVAPHLFRRFATPRHIAGVGLPRFFSRRPLM